MEDNEHHKCPTCQKLRPDFNLVAEELQIEQQPANYIAATVSCSDPASSSICRYLGARTVPLFMVLRPANAKVYKLWQYDFSVRNY